MSFSLTKTFSLNQDAKLIDLKKEIEKEFLMKEQEYDLFLNGFQLVIINNDTTLSSLSQQLNSNVFQIKSFKSTLI